MYRNFVLKIHREKCTLCIQVNIIYFKYIISLYIRKYITSSPQALNLIEYTGCPRPPVHPISFKN